MTSIERTQALSEARVTPAIPPPVHAVVHGEAETGRLEKKGMFAFRNKCGYGQRSYVEAQMSRTRRRIEALLLTRKIESQQHEGVTISNPPNR